MTRPNLPNAISLFRILLVPVLMVFLLIEASWADIVAFVVFLVAAASDFVDGYLARRRGQVTVMGAFLDPLADKLLVIGALVALVEPGRLSAWVVMVVIARELAVSGLRMVAAAQDVVISASMWGKTKTASQMLAIAVLIVEPRWLGSVSVGGHGVGWYLVILMLVLTVISGFDYFWKARRLLADALRQSPRKKGTPPPNEGG